MKESTIVDIGDLARRDESRSDDVSPIVRKEVDRLPEKYRRPIELCLWHGLTSDEAAAQLRCPVGTVKWRLSRAREILRDRLLRLGVLLAIFLGWRVPASATQSPRDGLPGADPSRRDPFVAETDAALPRELLIRTIAIARHVRDHRIAGLPSNPETPNPIRRVRRPHLLLVGMIVVAIATGFAWFWSDPTVQAAVTVWVASDGHGQGCR